MDNHDFCRLHLKLTRQELNSKQRKHLVGSWSYLYRWSGTVDSGEWHGPDGFYWHGNCCCAYNARSQGISAWMERFYPEHEITEM